MAYAISEHLMPRRTPPSNRQASPKVLAPGRLAHLQSRLNELGDLPPGWDDKGSPPIGMLALSTTRDLLMSHPTIGDRADLFPTAAGGVLVEFLLNGWDLSIEVQPNGTLELYGFEIGTKKEILPTTFPRADSRFDAALDAFGG